MASRPLATKRDGACAACGVSLAAGTRATWDSVLRTVTCLECQAVGDATTKIVNPPEKVTPAILASPVIDTGRPGASARKEYERRAAKHERRVEAKWGTGRIGRIAKFLSAEPQSTTAWARGAHGESRVAELLDETLAGRAVVLHDRKVPKTRGNIDHLVIGPNGVWIIDAKNYAGKVERRDVGGFFKTDMRLYVAGRDRTKVVEGLTWQVAAVQRALGDEPVLVQPSLSFVGADWGMFAKPFQLNGVWVGWTARLAEMMVAPGPIDRSGIDRLAQALATRLPAN